MVVVTRAGCRAALFLWIFSSISCRARTALPASRKYLFQRTMHIFSSVISFICNRSHTSVAVEM
uniref:Uncharacterized protein n=1 Tax=Apteryx owenii TaxID=8824 RepID=A0A8B9P2P6_APTOW